MVKFGLNWERLKNCRQSAINEQLRIRKSCRHHAINKYYIFGNFYQASCCYKDFQSNLCKTPRDKLTMTHCIVSIIFIKVSRVKS